MKSAQFYGPGDIRIEDIEADLEPKAGEVLVDITAVGVCGSDLHYFTAGSTGDTYNTDPFSLGHEAAGRIVKVGPGVDNFEVGQRVAIDPATPCLKCEFCHRGDIHLCTDLIFIGLFPNNGAMREKLVHPARSCIALPDEIDDVDGAMLEPLGVVVHATGLADIQPGEDVAVFGSGTIGLLLIRLAKLAGAKRVFATDKLDHRLEFATMYGADYVFNPDEVDPVAEIMRITGGRGVDLAYEAAWVRDTAGQAVDAAARGGRVIIVGIPDDDTVTFRASSARRKELKITYSRRMKDPYPEAIELVKSGKVDVKTLATHRYKLEETPEAFKIAAAYDDNIVRAIIMPN